MTEIFVLSELQMFTMTELDMQGIFHLVYQSYWKLMQLN